LEAQLSEEIEQLADVDEDAVRKFRALKLRVEEHEYALRAFDDKVNRGGEQIEEVRRRWLARLQELVEAIAVRFSRYFEIMGYAGDVVLEKGKHENDFKNYGIDVMVKFRPEEPMRRLTPHLQSGGERSVATALYMLALQDLTVVPFRCVDEINQGMDAKNERKVFDLLTKVSSGEGRQDGMGGGSQYFLLTPKLLPNLDLDEESLTVLVVNNGEHMCSHREWNMAEFVQAAKARHC